MQRNKKIKGNGKKQNAFNLFCEKFYDLLERYKAIRIIINSLPMIATFVSSIIVTLSNTKEIIDEIYIRTIRANSWIVTGIIMILNILTQVLYEIGKSEYVDEVGVLTSLKDKYLFYYTTTDNIIKSIFDSLSDHIKGNRHKITIHSNPDRQIELIKDGINSYVKNTANRRSAQFYFPDMT